MNYIKKKIEKKVHFNHLKLFLIFYKNRFNLLFNYYSILFLKKNNHILVKNFLYEIGIKKKKND